MTLSAGTRLGPYEVLAPLGAGGMGEVYRARDTRLGREVAVKVLPSAFSADRDRLRRFEQEARAASALNHPNILTIHDIGTRDGAPYVVSELLEGETLREKLVGSALPVRKTVDYAIQIAHGLAAAHEKGIVHRDLKPENLFVTRDGRVKILDFGLAKLTRLETGGVPLTEVPTLTAGTEPGVVLGTVGYMSPEQVRGQAADHRSDIFAFGSILYEMLSGRRAFRGDSAIEMLNAILKEDPSDLAETNRNVPPGLERVVRHCLEKSPDERFQSARDLAFDLVALSEVSGPSGVQLILARPRRKLRRALAGLMLLAFLLAAFLVGRRMGFVAGSRAGEKPSPSFRQLTFRHGYIFSARFAPDGHTIVYSGAWDGNLPQLFTTRAESAESSPLALPSADVLSISSSGELALSLGRRYLEGFASRGTLAQVPLAGGAPREILEDVAEADWALDGTGLAVVRRSEGRYRLEFPIGKVLYTTAGWISHARVSLKGDLVAFFDHPFYGDDRGSVAVVDRAGKKKILSEGWSSGQGLDWSRTGEEVWFTASAPEAGTHRDLHAVTLSGQRRLVLRVPSSILLHDIFRDGRILLARETIRAGIVGVSAGERKERDLSWHDFSAVADLSADGKMILFAEQGLGAGPSYAVYIRKTDGSPAIRLGEGLALALSPDKKWALSLLLTPPQRLVLLPTGPGETKPLEQGGIQDYGYNASWLPDGKRILFEGREGGRAARLYVQAVEEGGDPSPRAVTPEGIQLSALSHTVSPDGKFVAAIGPDNKAWLYPVEGGEPRQIPALAAPEEPIGWSGDGRSLYTFKRGDFGAKIYRLDLSTQRKDLWKEVTPADPGGILGINPIQMTPDGNSYAYSYFRVLSDLYLVEGLK